MAILSSTGITGFLSSAKATGNKILTKAGELIPEYMVDFASGFAGHGWKIWDYGKKNEVGDEDKNKSKWKLEIDSIVVRDTMTVFELLIQKIRSVKGALNISQASGKIKTAELKEDGNWYITIEDEMSFMSHDIVRCQTWKDSTLKGYWVEISEVRRIEGIDTVIIPASEFTGNIESNEDHLEYVKPSISSMSTPEVGDEIIQFGNSELRNRQSAIYLHADEGGQPAIDVLFDINTKSFAGCLKMRLGGDIPGGNGAKGFYCENGMIRCVAGNDIIYQLSPDGSFSLGKGSVKYNPETHKLVFGRNVKFTWANFDDSVKDEMKGDTGAQGEPGKDGINGADGISGEPGKEGVSLIYKGESASHPADPQNGWYYRNTTDKKCYVYQDSAWYQMTVDGIDGINGKDGNDGLDVVWKGDSSTPPDNPQKNWVYRDTDNGKVYIYNGSEWVLMVADGNDGSDGASGSDGMSVFVTYNDSESEPDKPTGSGTTDEWHTNATATVIWMSQKVAESADSGEWGEPIKIKGNTGDQGPQGVRGDDGTSVTIKGTVESESELPMAGNQIGDGYIVSGYLYIWGGDSWTNAGKIQGPSGATPYVHIKYSDDGGTTFTSNNGETIGDWMGIYTDYEEADSKDVSKYKWSKTKGDDGLNGTTYYTWIRYADDLNGNGISNQPDGKTCIGFAYNKTTQEESNKSSDYIWSLIKGTDGQPGLPGEDGKPTYTWIAYSDSADGSEMYQMPNDATKYIGIAINKDTATEGNNSGDYTWSKFRGEDAIVYSIEFTQDDNVITSIPACSNGVPKSVNSVYATLYKTIGDFKSECSDFHMKYTCKTDDGGDAPFTFYQETSNIEIPVSEGGKLSYTVYIARHFGINSYLPFMKSTITVIRDGAAGADANLLPWLEEWDGYVGQYGAEYMATPKMFSGVKKEDGSLTGIAQGKNCIAINGVEKTGIYGLKDGNITFSIDANTGDVYTTGDMITNAVMATGLNIQDKFVIDLDENGQANVSMKGKLETAAQGTRVVIDPTYNASQGMYPGVTIYDDEGGVVSTFNASKVASINDIYGDTNEQWHEIQSLDWSESASSLEKGEIIHGTLLSFNSEHSGIIRVPRMSILTNILTYDPVYKPGIRPMLSLEVSLYANGVLLGSCGAPLYADGTGGGKTIDTNIQNISVMKGANRITYTIAYSIPAITAGRIALSSRITPIGELSFISNIYMSRYFANGFALGSSTQNFFECLNVNNSMLVRGVMDNYGLNMTNKGLQLKINGKWYTLSISGDKINATEASLLD